ncbi:MAG: hypothetical protein U0O04_02815 [Clostridia bacterium]
MLLIKKKKTNEYIPFGPFIAIASFIIIFVPFNIILRSCYWGIRFNKKVKCR